MKSFLLKALISFTIFFTLGVANVNAEDSKIDEVFENTTTQEEQIKETKTLEEKKTEEQPTNEVIKTIGATNEKKTNNILIILSSGCLLLISGVLVKEIFKNKKSTNN